MNTDKELPTKAIEPPDDFEPPRGILTEHPSAKLLENIQQLQIEIAQERDKRREHAFIFVLVIVALFDVLTVKLLDGGMASLFTLFAFEIPFLIGLATRLGVDWVVDPLNRTLGFFNRRLNKTE